MMNHDTGVERLLTIEEVAEMLHMSVPALRARIHAGTAPPSARLGKRRFWRASQISRWLDEVFADAA